MTVRHLFTHTSGLGYAFTSPTLRDFKPRAGEKYPVGPLLFEPGEQWMYGTSTDLVGRLVEKISGQKLEDYFRQHIFTPLKMSDTSYNVPEDKRPRLVPAQQRDGDRMDGTIVKQAVQPRAHRLRSRSAAADCRRPRATTSASCACCSTAASSTAPRVLKPETGRADGPEPDRRRRRSRAEDGAAAQRGLLASSPTAATSGGSAS